MIPVVELLQNEKNHGDRFRGALVHIISNGPWLIPTFVVVVTSYS